MSHENLWRELQAKEQRDDSLYDQELTGKATKGFVLKPLDRDKAMHLVKTEIAPVFARRKRAMSSKAYRLFLKVTGQWKGMEPADVELVNPTRGPVATGLTEAEILEQIAKDPTKFKTGSIAAPPVSPVNAERRNIEPRIKGEVRDD